MLWPWEMHEAAGALPFIAFRPGLTLRAQGFLKCKSHVTSQLKTLQDKVQNSQHGSRGFVPSSWLLAL